MATARRVWCAIPPGAIRAPASCQISVRTCSIPRGSGSAISADDFKVISANCFENRAPDHVVIGTETGAPKLEFEMTLLSWRNHFTCDVFAEKGSAHIESLCKWGPTTFTHRMRILPSGRPPEEAVTLTQEDPTWAIEYDHFKRLVADRAPADLSNDRWLLSVLGRLSGDVTKMAKPA